jgi:hexaprenyl-diphosphate synthase
MLSRISRAARKASQCRRGISTNQPRQSPRPSPSSSSTWAAATESAHSILQPPPSSQPLSSYDPLSAIHAEIGQLKSSLLHLLGSSHPSLDTVAKYYFQAEGKHLRPLLVLLMSQATNGLGRDGWERVKEEGKRRAVDDSLTAAGGVLNDWNPDMMGPESQAHGAMMFAEPFRIPTIPIPLPHRLPRPPLPLDLPSSSTGPQILSTQRRLASITEMIHVASLLHDDVIDTSPLRRGSPSAPQAFGNKLSILSGDFLLGRASVALARLGSTEVVELLATVIANLVEGEVMQLRATSEPETTPTKRGFEDYMRKTYLKTASLMAKSARAAVILGGCGGKDAEWVKDVAYGYGRNLGIAFQVSISLDRSFTSC